MGNFSLKAITNTAKLKQTIYWNYKYHKHCSFYLLYLDNSSDCFHLFDFSRFYRATTGHRWPTSQSVKYQKWDVFIIAAVNKYMEGQDKQKYFILK